MVTSDIWTEIDARLPEIFSASIELPFSGLLMVIIGDYLQLPLARQKFIFSRLTNGSTMNQLISVHLWYFLNMPN